MGNAGSFLSTALQQPACPAVPKQEGIAHGSPPAKRPAASPLPPSQLRRNLQSVPASQPCSACHLCRPVRRRQKSSMQLQQLLLLLPHHRYVSMHAQQPLEHCKGSEPRLNLIQDPAEAAACSEGSVQQQLLTALQEDLKTYRVSAL